MRRTAIGNPLEASQNAGVRSPELGLRLLSNDLAADPTLVTVAFLMMLENVKTLSKDPKEMPFASTATPANQITSVTLDNATSSITIQAQTSQAGYYLESIKFVAQVSGGLETASIRIIETGRSANPIAHVMSSQEPYYVLPWDGLFTTAHTLQIHCDGIPAGESVQIDFTSVATLPDAAYRQNARMRRIQEGNSVSDGYADFKSGVADLAQKGLGSMVNKARAKKAAAKASAAGPLKVSSSNINALGTFVANTNR